MAGVAAAAASEVGIDGSADARLFARAVVVLRGSAGGQRDAGA